MGIRLFSFLDNIIVLEVCDKTLESIGILEFGSNTNLIGFFPSTNLVVSNGSSSIEFSYKIFNSRGEKTTEGSTLLAFLNSETMRPVRCPKIISDLF